MIRYKIGSSIHTALGSESTAPRMEDVVNAIIASKEADGIVSLNFGARYVMPERSDSAWHCVTYIVGKTKSGERVSIGMCDYVGPIDDAVLFMRA